MVISQQKLTLLSQLFGERLHVDVPLKGYTAARIGGNADVLVSVSSSTELSSTARTLWELDLPFIMLGSGSNLLVSDRGVREVVILNQAKKVRFDVQQKPPTVLVESGANLGALARHAATWGLSGLEWAAGIPGTVGGAIYGNAGAHGSDIASNLVMAIILHRYQKNGDVQHEILQEEWSVDRFEYEYRSSSLKRQPGCVVVLEAVLKLESSTVEAVQATMSEFSRARRKSQPPGASLGSIFKNPPGDYAGRLLEAAGLKGTSIGKVEISPIHANFFINQDSATASDYSALIRLAQHKVYEQSGIRLELEIELVGDWSGNKP